MTRWLARTFKVTLTGLLYLTSTSGLAFAENTDSQNSKPKSPETEASTSLKNVLQKAGEQGLLRLEDRDAETTPSTKPTPEVQQDVSSETAVPGNVDCTISQIFDFTDYIKITSYDDIWETKASVTAAKTPSEIKALSKQYLALGLGAEVSALASPFETESGQLLVSMGHVVDGVATGDDINRINSYKTCSDMSEFWSIVAQASHEFNDTKNLDWGLTMDQLKILLDMPEHLKTVLVTRLGIHAAELEKKTLADQLLSLIEPQSRRGLLPSIQDDDRLYYYALVRQMKGDPVSSQIFKHLGRSDGVYQARALLKLIKQSPHKDQHAYDEFSSALLSVQQQYRGSAPSRKATLEVVKHQAEDGQYIYAIDLSKTEFSPTDIEMQNAIDSIGAELNTNLLDESSHKKLRALNGYLYDPNFFSTFVHIGELKSHAFETALKLNLPELALKVPTATVVASKDLVYTRQLADAQISYKNGDYEKVVELSRAHSEDPRYRELLLKSSRKIASQNAQEKILGTVPEGAEKLKLEADIAIQNSRWEAAQTALTALSESDASDTKTKETLAIVEYVAANDDEDKRIVKSDTVADIETLNDKIDADINLVKAYLKNG